MRKEKHFKSDCKSVRRKNKLPKRPLFRKNKKKSIIKAAEFFIIKVFFYIFYFFYIFLINSFHRKNVIELFLTHFVFYFTLN